MQFNVLLRTMIFGFRICYFLSVRYVVLCCLVYGQSKERLSPIYSLNITQQEVSASLHFTRQTKFVREKSWTQCKRVQQECRRVFL